MLAFILFKENRASAPPKLTKGERGKIIQEKFVKDKSPADQSFTLESKLEE